MSEQAPNGGEDGWQVQEPLIDLRDPPDLHVLLRTNDQFERNSEIDEFVSAVFNRILLVGVAARDAVPGTLVLRNDRPLADGRMLQQEAINVLQGAAQAGLDRLRGNHMMDSVDHAVYERLFERSEDKTHNDFIGRLAWIGQQKWHILHNREFDMNREERQQFKSIEADIERSCNRFFEEMFYPVASHPDKQIEAAIILDNLVDPAIGAEFLDASYWSRVALHLSRRRRVSTPGKLQYRSWLIEQGRLMRSVAYSGKIALQSEF